MLPSLTDAGPHADRVDRVAAVDLVVERQPWPFAERNAVEIARHWQVRQAAAPGLFDGRVHILHRLDIADGRLSGALLEVDFKSFLFWRDQGHPDASVRDAFGSAILSSADGKVLLGRQRAGNINAGKAYLPGGFIDPRDVDRDGRIDIDGSVAREIREETGLNVARLERVPGYLVTRCGPLVSFAAEHRIPLAAGDLAAAVRAHIAADPDPELEDVVLVDAGSDLAALDVPPYARLALAALFQEQGGRTPI